MKIIFSLSHLTLRILQIFHLCGQFSENVKNFEVPVRKKRSFRQFDGDHLYVLDIEFRKKIYFFTRHLEVF